MSEPASLENGVADEEVAEEEQESTLVKKEIVADEGEEKEEVMHEVPVVAGGDDADRTEDQVPDITPGSENAAEPEAMTTSVDEIEELPATGEEDEAAVEELPQGDEAPEGGEVAEIPVAVMEEEPVAEEEKPAEEEQPPQEEEQPAAEEEQPPPEEEAEEESAPVEEIPVETMEESTEQKEEEAGQEAAIDVPLEEEQAFELQEPPAPKRPRTPNELDEMPADEADAVDEASAEDAAPAEPENEVAPVEGGGEVEDAAGAPQTPKSPGARRSSALSAGRGETTLVPNGTIPSEVQNHVGSPAATTPLRTPRSAARGAEFKYEEKQPTPSATPRSPKKTTFEDEVLLSSKSSSPSKSPSRRSKSPRSPRKKRVPKSAAAAEPEGGDAAVGEEEKSEEVSQQDEEQPAPPQDETAQAEMKEIAVEVGDEEQQKEEGDELGEEAPVRSSRRVQSPSPPPRARREAGGYTPAYEQDLGQETMPARLPTSTSFSSFVAPERESYKSISPWVSTAGKYRNEYTTGVAPPPTSTYTGFFEDLVSTGPFSSSLYSTSRVLERSRSRTRERRQAMRSHRSASNYYRFASQYPAPLRTRDYSTPPSTLVSRGPSHAGSYASFMGYSGSKNYEMARDYSRSRGSLYDSNQALSRWASRGNVDYYLGAGRLSRVDSYVNNLNSRYEWGMPANYELYRSASRYNVGYAPLNEYSSYTNPPSPYYDYSSGDVLRRIRRYASTTRSVRGQYEGRIDTLERSLSRERYERDRLRSKYTQVTHQLEQACKQMDLIRCNSYGPLRSGSQPRTSVYAHFYPYY